MNNFLSVILLAEIFSMIIKTDAAQGWNWDANSKHKQYRHRYESNHRCSQGQCVHAWKCPKTAQFTGSCTDWSSEPMVCCVLNNEEISHGLGKTNIFTYKSTAITPTEHFKQTSPDFWKQIMRTATENYDVTGKSHLNTPRLEDPLNRNSRERPTPLSSSTDLLVNLYRKFTTSIPLNRVTNVQHGYTKKRTSVFDVVRTTGSWYKPSISESRIIFPTESAWMPKPTKYTAQTTKVLRTTSDRKSTKPNSWPIPSGITIAPLEYTTRKTVFRTIGSSHSKKSTKSTTPYKSEDRRFQGWNKSTPTHPTRGQTMNSKITNRPKITLFTPRTTKRYTSTIPTHSTRGQTTNSKITNRPKITLSTSKTTKRYISTTPLPNVNEHMCGFRNQRTHRQKRDSDVHNPVGDFIYADASKDRQPYERIVGGKEAEPFSWPWVAALYKVTSSGGNRFLSAGSLINENFVLTAAHIFTPEDLRTVSFVIMLGTHDAQDAIAEYLVSSVLQHPRYEPRYYYHDIALLKLHKSVVFNNYVMPVCLPSPNAPLLTDRDLEGKRVTVMGWGDDSFGGKSSRVLKEATFPVVSRVSCNTSYIRVASNRFPKGITNDMLCAGDPNGGKDACQGDSGGPLTSVENGRYTQVGIVSFGYKCGDKEYPGVYTKVAPYLSWIAENTRCEDDYVNYEY